jgi:putative ABC transport system substrate-binding protein
MWFTPVGGLVTLILSLLAVPLAAEAQPAAKIPTVGVLEPHPYPGAGCLAAFQRGLGDLGYREGQNILLEYRYGELTPDRLPALATDLVQRQPDVLWTHSTRAALAVQQATTTIPIVVGASGDLVDAGLVASRSRPGGNLTGLESRSTELLGKQLEVLKAAVPTITRVAVLVHPAMPGHERIPGNIEPEARTLGLRLLHVEAGEPETFAAAFTAMIAHRAEALVIVDFARPSPEQLVELAVVHRLPTIAAPRFLAEAGGLLAYGVNPRDLCQRSASYVDRILKGAKPADLPVEGPIKFELVINLKTAQALGLTIPPILLFQADKVIQ